MNDIKTYNPKEVVISFGNHMVTGFADDSFIAIEANSEGITKKVGCDGEVVRAVSPDNTFKVRITLLQTSESNSYFSRMVDYDRETGEGMLPLLIKDLRGGVVFHADAAWISRKAPLTRGRDSNNREWEFDTGEATLDE